MMIIPTLAKPPETIVNMLDSYFVNMGVYLDSVCLDMLPVIIKFLHNICVRAVGICRGPFTFSNNFTGNVCSIFFMLGFTTLASVSLYCLKICQKARFTVNLNVRS